jgi:hypothetical protein
MIVYKLCCKYEGYLCSFNPSPTHPVSVRYELGVATYPPRPIPNSYLFAFSSIEASTRFRDRTVGFQNLGDYPIYKAEAEVSELIPKLISTNIAVTAIAWFWSNDNFINSKSTYTTFAPDGTVWCKSITLLERLPENLYNSERLY